MNTQNEMVENFNEMVFENRNKAYGAYLIRRGYQNSMSFSLLLAVLFFGFIALAALAFTRNNVPPLTKKDFVVNKDSMVSILIELPHEMPKPTEAKKKIEEPKPHSDDRNFTATDKKPDTDIKPNDLVTITKQGTLDGKDSVPPTDIIPDMDYKKPVENNTVVLIPGEMPEFKGNLFQYLADNIKYPRMAVENYTQGQVFLTFVVEKDGSIGDVKTLRPLADGCTEEAIRVVKGMPKWKPGKNHGEPVRVQFNLPIKFRLRN